jgi:hypothetical protein
MAPRPRLIQSFRNAESPSTRVEMDLPLFVTTLKCPNRSLSLHSDLYFHILFSCFITCDLWPLMRLRQSNDGKEKASQSTTSSSASSASSASSSAQRRCSSRILRKHACTVSSSWNAEQDYVVALATPLYASGTQRARIVFTRKEHFCLDDTCALFMMSCYSDKEPSRNVLFRDMNTLTNTARPCANSSLACFNAGRNYTTLQSHCMYLNMEDCLARCMGNQNWFTHLGRVLHENSFRTEALRHLRVSSLISTIVDFCMHVQALDAGGIA